jgi:hypothetical protein
MFDQVMQDTTSAPQTHAELTLLSGTTILTAKGESRVEDLKAGDRIITRDSGMSVLSDVRHGKSACGAVLIKAGALGIARPDRDVTVPEDALIQLRDGQGMTQLGKAAGPVPAQQFSGVDRMTGLPDACRNCVTLCFDRRHVIYADGLELSARAG